MSDKPRVGISACLLGEEVRFDGGHKRNPYVVNKLAGAVELVPVCPEVEAGFPTPRETMRLGRFGGRIRVTGNRSGENFTPRLRAWSEQRVSELESTELDGYIFMKNSPSCGLSRVKVYEEREDGSRVDASPSKTGIGVFADAVQRRMPTLALTEDGWLHDPGLRDTFLERLFTHHRMRTQLLVEPTRAKLVDFHSEHKLMYMARSPEGYRKLGRLVGRRGERPLEAVLDEYVPLAMETLRKPATPGRQANVLQHIVGYFKGVLSHFEKQEIVGLIDEFRRGFHGLAVPLTLLRHHLNKHQQSEWLARQRYFAPYPRGLQIRAAPNLAR